MAGEMSTNWKKNQTIESYFGDKEDQSIQTEENKVKAPPSKASKKNMSWSQTMEELKRDFENQVRSRAKLVERNESDARKS